MQQELIETFALQGRVAVVTGAGSGIGQETARVLAAAGADLALGDLNEAGLLQTVAAVEALGRKAIMRVTDISRRADVEALADAALQTGGRLDGWVNSAAVLSGFTILDADEAEVDRILSTNLKGAYWGCAAAGRVMKAAGRGSIVNISSAAADNPVAMISAYAMSKAAVNMLTRSAAVEFGAFGCRVNAVAPGFVDTPMVSSEYLDAEGQVDPQRRTEFLAARARATPLGLTGRPRDIALAVLYLVSDASRFVTGQVIRPNGGIAMR